MHLSRENEQSLPKIYSPLWRRSEDIRRSCTRSA